MYSSTLTFYCLSHRRGWVSHMLHLYNSFQRNNSIVESQNHLGWKRHLRSSCPTFKIVLTSPPQNHATKSYMYTFFEYLQGWWLNYFPGQPVPILQWRIFQWRNFSVKIFQWFFFFLISNLNIPWCNLRPFHLVSSLGGWEKRLMIPTSL